MKKRTHLIPVIGLSMALLITGCGSASSGGKDNASSGSSNAASSASAASSGTAESASAAASETASSVEETAASATSSASESAPSDTSAASETAASSTAAEVVSEIENADTEIDWSEITVGYSGFNAPTEYLTNVFDSVQKAVESRGGKFIHAESDLDAQAIKTSIESLVLQGADIIVDFTFNTELFDGGYAQELADKNIPIISVDTEYKEPAHLYGCDIAQQGTVAAQTACDYINKEWNGEVDEMVVMYLQSAGESGNQRSYAAEKTFLEQFPDVSTNWIDITGTGGDSTGEALVKARDYLTAHPDSHHIYFEVHSDSQAISVFSAVQQAGRLDDCIIVSVDGQTEAIQTIKENEGKCWIATVAAFPSEYGEGIAAFAEEILSDPANAPHTMLKDSTPVTINNIHELYPD